MPTISVTIEPLVYSAEVEFTADPVYARLIRDILAKRQELVAYKDIFVRCVGRQTCFVSNVPDETPHLIVEIKIPHMEQEQIDQLMFHLVQDFMNQTKGRFKVRFEFIIAAATRTTFS